MHMPSSNPRTEWKLLFDSLSTTECDVHVRFLSITHELRLHLPLVSDAANRCMVRDDGCNLGTYLLAETSFSSFFSLGIKSTLTRVNSSRLPIIGWIFISFLTRRRGRKTQWLVSGRVDVYVNNVEFTITKRTIKGTKSTGITKQIFLKLVVITGICRGGWASSIFFIVDRRTDRPRA